MEQEAKENTTAVRIKSYAEVWKTSHGFLQRSCKNRRVYLHSQCRHDT